jgi:hypothetical protein
MSLTNALSSSLSSMCAAAHHRHDWLIPIEVRPHLGASEAQANSSAPGLVNFTVCSGLVPADPALCNRAIERGAELIWRATGLEEGVVDQLDKTPAEGCRRIDSYAETSRR